EKSEQGLRDAVRDQARTLDEKSRAKVEAEVELEQFWMEEGKPGAPDQNSLQWAAAQSAADLDETRGRLEGLRNLIDRLDAATQAHESFRRAETDAAQRLVEVDEARRAADAAAIGASEAMQLIAVLRDARGFLGASPDTAWCPVCEQPVDAETLRRRIDERLDAMTTLGGLRDRLDAANKFHQSAVTIVERDRKQMLDATAALVEMIKKVNEPRLALLPPDDAPKLIEGVSATRDMLIAARDEVQKAINQFNSIHQFHRRVIECGEELREAESLRQGLERALEIVQSERIRFTQCVLAEVRDETN